MIIFLMEFPYVNSRNVSIKSGEEMKKIMDSGSLLVFCGALFWSLNSPLVKYLTLDPLVIIVLRSVIAGIVLLPLLRPKRLNWSAWTLVYAVSYLCLTLGVVISLSMTVAPIGVGMQYSSIIWFFLADLWKTRKVRIRTLVPVLVVFTGVVLFMCSGGGQGSDTAGNLIALTEGVSFTFLTVSSKKSAGENPVGLVAIANLFTALILFPFVPQMGAKISVMSSTEWLVMLMLGAVQVGMGYTFYNMGVSKVSAQKSSIIALWEVILGTFWVMIFLHEYPNLMVLAGFVIILIGMLLDALWTQPEKS